MPIPGPRVTTTALSADRGYRCTTCGVKVLIPGTGADGRPRCDEHTPANRKPLVTVSE